MPFVGPPVGFYETAVPICAAGFVAILVEVRILHVTKEGLVAPGRDFKRPWITKWRQRFQNFVFVMTVLLSWAGTIAGFTALYAGGSKILGLITFVGVMTIAGSLGGLTIRVLAHVYRDDLQFLSKHERGLQLGFGGLIFATGLALSIWFY